MANLSATETNRKWSLDTEETDFKEEKSPTSRFEDLLRPLWIFMSIFGLYCPQWNEKTKNRWYSVCMIYSGITIVILVAGFVTYVYFDFSKSDDFGPIYAMHINNCLYNALNVITGVTIRILWFRKDGFRATFRQWDNLHQGQLYSTKYKLMINLKRFIIIAVSLCGCIVSMALLFKGYSRLFAKNLVSVSAVDIFRLIAQFYNTGAYILPMCLVAVTSFALYADLKTFQEEFRRAISPTGQFHGDFEEYRRRHRDIANIIDSIDSNFCFLIGPQLVVSVGQILLEVYIAIWHPDYNSQPMKKTMMLLWISNGIFCIVTVCLSGGLIHHMAHAPFPDIHQLDMNKNKAIHVQVQMFLSRLTGEKIGLTIMKIWVIDKTTISTVAGVFITYFLVLQQFQSAASISRNQVECNATLFAQN